MAPTISQSPKVSVLVPCYNAAAFIDGALESILAQTWPHVEVIVVDDGSTDASFERATRYADRGVRVLTQQHRGQCAAANTAFAASRGELIKFFDADDVLGPDHIEKQVNRLAQRRDAIVMGEWARFYGNEPTQAIFEQLPMYRDSLPVDWLAREWMNAQPMMQCAVWLIPRGILDRVGLWDERLSLINDFEFIARVLLGASEILWSPGARLYYRSGINGSLSGRKSRAAIESAFLSISLGTGHLLAAENSPRTHRACANIFQSFEYEHYPYHADLRAKARVRIAELGGSDLEPVGPPRFQKLRKLVGWRAARCVQLAMSR